MTHGHWLKYIACLSSTHSQTCAAAEFGEIESAYRVLTDASAKEALDNFMK